MNIILLSGGSGKRLWPLSNEVRSKQFLEIFKLPDGTYESMLQRVYRMLHAVDKTVSVTIATSENQVSLIRSQLQNQVDISVEPCRRDTFPAIALASAYLHDIKGMDEEEIVTVCPVDPYVEPAYFQMLFSLSEQAAKGEAHLVLMGIEPTYPSEKYGYILPASKDNPSFVREFKEKPDAETAKGYIFQGALWNCGVFAFRLKYVLDIAQKTLGTCKYKVLLDHYDSYPKISFDYAVVEQEKQIQVMRFAGMWKDLGTWNTLTEAMNDTVVGNVKTVECENTHVINELKTPLIAMNVRNLVIVATPDGTLVSEKQISGRIKDYVDSQEPMQVKQDWGEYQILNYEDLPDKQGYSAKQIIVFPHQQTPIQQLTDKLAILTIVAGKGKMILDSKQKGIACGDTVRVEPGTQYSVFAETELRMIEVLIYPTP